MKITIQQIHKIQSNGSARRAAAGACAAWTLAEVLVATLVVAISFSSLGLGLVQGFEYVQEARDNLRATQIMADRMEVIRLYTWDELNAPGYVPTSFTTYTWPTGLAKGRQGTTFTGSLAISNSPLTEIYSNDVRQVVLDLSWRSKLTQHHRQMTTLVSRYGIQNYIYSTK